MNSEVKNYIYIIFGVILTAIGINMFYVPNELVSGGVSGIGIIVMYYTEKYMNFPFPVSLTNIILNIPLFILAYKSFGGKYIKRSAIATVLFSAALQFTTLLPQYIGDLMLASIFGGILMGTGVGFVLNGSATTGGTETAAHLLHHKSDKMSVSNYIFLIDAIIIAAGLFAFGSEKAMFAIISVFVASKCIDAVSSGTSLDKAAFIISDWHEDIAKSIKANTGREITALNSYRGAKLGKNNCSNTLICVFSQKEITQIKEIVKSVDSFAFIILFDIKEVYGGGFKKL